MQGLNSRRTLKKYIVVAYLILLNSLSVILHFVDNMILNVVANRGFQ